MIKSQCLRSSYPVCPYCGMSIRNYLSDVYHNLEVDEIEVGQVCVAYCPNCDKKFLVQMFHEVYFNTFQDYTN